MNRSMPETVVGRSLYSAGYECERRARDPGDIGGPRLKAFVQLLAKQDRVKRALRVWQDERARDGRHGEIPSHSLLQFVRLESAKEGAGLTWVLWRPPARVADEAGIDGPGMPCPCGELAAGGEAACANGDCYRRASDEAAEFIETRRGRVDA
jgi:hypothetical protein